MPAALLKNKIVRFILDMAMSAVAAAILVFIANGILESLGTGFLFLLSFTGLILPLFFFIAFVGPAATFLVGAIRGRIGLALGPVAFMIFAPIVTHHIWRHSFERNLQLIEPTIQEKFVSPSHPVNTVILGSTGALCDIACAQIIGRLHVDVVTVPEGYQPSIITRYSLKSDEACRSRSNFYNQLELTKAGFPDLCISSSHLKEIPDGLLLRIRDYRDGHFYELPAGSFYGKSYEVIERFGGEENVLTRLMWGTIAAPTTIFPIAYVSKMMGMDFTVKHVGVLVPNEQFYSRALNITVSQNPQISAADLPAVIQRLNALRKLDKHDAADELLRLSFSYQQEHAELFRSEIEELLKSSDSHEIEIAVRLIFSDPDENVGNARLAQILQGDDIKLKSVILAQLNVDRRDRKLLYVPSLLAGLSSPNPQVVVSALKGAANPSETTRAALNSAVLNVLFRDDLWGYEADLARPFIYAVDEVSSPEVIGRSKNLLGNKDTRFIQQRVAAFAVICKGGQREAAFGLLASLDADTFSQTVVGLSQFRWDALCNSKSYFLQNAETETLIKRIEDVPIDALQEYLLAVRDLRFESRDKGNFESAIKRRAREIEVSGSADAIKKVDRILSYWGL